MASLTHDQAMVQPRWDEVDVAIVDAADEGNQGDQFPGVGVVESIRARGGVGAKVIVITGHFFDDAVRWRMREAGADFFYHRIELHDAAALYRAVLDADGPGIPAEHDPEALFRLGIGPTTKVNAAVAFSKAYSLDDPRFGRALRRARARLRYRLRFGQETGLRPVNADGRPPERGQDAPSLPQIQRFIEWATKVKGPSRHKRLMHPTVIIRCGEAGSWFPRDSSQRGDLGSAWLVSRHLPGR